MKKPFIFLYVLVSIQAACGEEDFDRFVKRFFLDTSFQISRTSFPLKETMAFINAKTNSLDSTDTIAAKNKGEWQHIQQDAGESGALYTIVGGATSKVRESGMQVVEFSKVDTDFNLRLIFENQNGRWILLRKRFFEP